MSSPIRIIVHGAAGRIGRSILDLLHRDTRFVLTAAVVKPGSELEGQPVANVVVPGEPRYQTRLDDLDADVLIDFSTPHAAVQALQWCASQQVRMVSGTTGFDQQAMQVMQQACQSTAVLHAANFSLGVALLMRWVREAAAALPEWDLEIAEAHHARKEDAPSGTALALGRVAAAARGCDFEQCADLVRQGHTGPRQPGHIGFAVTRAGDIVGEHSVLLVGRGERLELMHRADSRSIFARGALVAAAWLSGRESGRYELEQVLQGMDSLQSR
ncbi:MAG TPA: 4-hydroxy-tetrahydrodipicolinate reductase [Mizugakiibacter sp.]|nr:4-hydroxy-tetrahydrodipicolinate reductase [Mizugakiibacter sp.]